MLGVLISLATNPSMAQGTRSVADCAAIENAEIRLECFDAAFQANDGRSEDGTDVSGTPLDKNGGFSLDQARRLQALLSPSLSVGRVEAEVSMLDVPFQQ